MSHESICSVCSRLTGFGDEDRFEPPVNLARCPAPGGLECRAVAQAVAPLRRENEVLRSNCDHLSSENASLVRQVESMAMRIETVAGVVPVEVHERGWQWRPIDENTAFAPPFGTIRQCRVCGCLVAGGPTACARCAKAGA